MAELTRGKFLLLEGIDGSGPSDEELDELAWNWYSKTGSTKWEIEAFRAFARAALARWGRPAASPVPEVGEAGEGS